MFFFSQTTRNLFSSNEMCRNLRSGLQLFLLFFLFFVLSWGTTSYPLTLLSIQSNHGTLSPSFSPNIYNYRIALPQVYEYLDITPEVDFNIPEYEKGAKTPLVLIEWQVDGTIVKSSLQRHIPLQADSTTIVVKVINPSNKNHFLSYRIVVIQPKNQGLVRLQHVNVTDDSDHMLVSFANLVDQRHNFSIFVRPTVKHIVVQASCMKKNQLTINDVPVADQSKIFVKREHIAFRQIIKIVCSRNGVSKSYIISVFTTLNGNKIPAPGLTVIEESQNCILNKNTYICPTLTTPDKIRLAGLTTPGILYTVESSDKTVRIRLNDRVPTIPFPYINMGVFSLVGTAGLETYIWQIRFSRIYSNKVLELIGSITSIIVVILLIVFALISSFTSVQGTGRPIGVPKITCPVLLVCQASVFFANLPVSQSTFYEFLSLTRPLRFTTMFWRFSIDIWETPLATLADPISVRTAKGCLLWSMVLFISLWITHFIIISIITHFSDKYTVPHCLSWNYWKTLFIFAVSFSTTLAATILLLHPFTVNSRLNWTHWLWTVLGGVVIIAHIFYCLLKFFQVKTQVREKQVLQIFESEQSSHSSRLQSYWTDMICDQLTSIPVNRSLNQSFYSFRWSATLADIEAVNVMEQFCEPMHANTNAIYQNQHDMSTDQQYLRRYSEKKMNPSNYIDDIIPFASSPLDVKILRTVSTKNICRGQHLFIGLFRLCWLDIMLSYEALTYIYRTILSLGEPCQFVVKVTVKFFQLSGPITGGDFNFYYDGTIIPWVRCYDTMFQIFTGICLGIVYSFPLHTSVSLISIFLVLASCIVICTYHWVYVPFSRNFDNITYVTTFLYIMTLSLLTFSGDFKYPAYVIQTLLWFAYICVIILVCIGAFILSNTTLALILPPLDESRLLEGMANCNVIIADERENFSWTLDVPGYAFYGVRDLKAQCSLIDTKKIQVSIFSSGEEPTIQLNVLSLLNEEDILQKIHPILCLYLPDKRAKFGYRQINIIDKETLYTEVVRFLSKDLLLQYMAENVASNINHQILLLSNEDTSSVSMTIIPPPMHNRSLPFMYF